jgi:hypothetical protein
MPRFISISARGVVIGLRFFSRRFERPIVADCEDLAMPLGATISRRDEFGRRDIDVTDSDLRMPSKRANNHLKISVPKSERPSSVRFVLTPFE